MKWTKLGLNGKCGKKVIEKVSFKTNKHEKVIRNLIKVLNLNQLGRTNSPMISKYKFTIYTAQKLNTIYNFSFGFRKCIVNILNYSIAD